jgi:hypothetical protein
VQYLAAPEKPEAEDKKGAKSTVKSAEKH